MWSREGKQVLPLGSVPGPVPTCSPTAHSVPVSSVFTMEELLAKVSKFVFNALVLFLLLTITRRALKLSHLLSAPAYQSPVATPSRPSLPFLTRSPRLSGLHLSALNTDYRLRFKLLRPQLTLLNSFLPVAIHR